MLVRKACLRRENALCAGMEEKYRANFYPALLPTGLDVDQARAIREGSFSCS